MNAHPLETLSAKYLSQKQISQSTHKSYQIAFKKYIEYLKKQKIDYASISDVIGYRESMRMLGYSSFYIHVHISALRGLYQYLSTNQKHLNLPEIYRYNIMNQIKNESIRTRITKPILTLEQAKQMILKTKAIRKYIWHYRNHAMVCLMLTGGLSRDEIVHAKRSDYLIEKGKPLLYLQKHGHHQLRNSVVIAKVTKEALDDYLEKRIDDNPYLFISHRNRSKHQHLSRTFFRRMFRSVLKTCNLDNTGITPHCLRHTAAMINLSRGGTLAQTQKLLRHIDIQSTMVYQDYLLRLKDDSESKIEKLILG